MSMFGRPMAVMAQSLVGLGLAGLAWGNVSVSVEADRAGASKKCRKPPLKRKVVGSLGSCLWIHMQMQTYRFYNTSGMFPPAELD